MKQNKGPFKPDSLTLCKKENQLWEEGKQLQDFTSSKRCGDVGEASSSPPRKKPKFDAFARDIAQQIAPEIAEKLGTLLRRSKEENEGKIRVLELKIKNLEAYVEKVNSELGAALERCEILQGKAESSEAREKKLKSELKAAVERNAKLEGGIKHTISSLESLVKKSDQSSQSEEARDDDSTVHEAEGDLQEEVHSEKHMVVEKDSAGKTELKSKSVGEESHVKNSTTGKCTKISSSSISKKEAEPRSKAKKGNEEGTATKGTSSGKSKSSEREQGKGESVTAVAEKQPSREEMQSAVAHILKEVDFNIVTTTTAFSDIVNQIGKHFGLDLMMHRRAEVEELVVDEIIKSMSDD